MPFCSPDKIVIGERFRTADLADPAVKEMADSIKECGQLQPVLVTKEMELVDGLHRLLASRLLGKEVWYEDEAAAKLLFENPAQRRRAELQANIRRKEFTPLQLSLGIAELDRLMRETYGERKSGPNLGRDDGWGQTDTAKMLGYKSHASISDALTVAKAVEAGAIPALIQAKTMTEAVKMVKEKVRLEAAVELAKRASARGGQEIKDLGQFFGEKIILGDGLAGLKKLSPGICSLFVTDPPWFIGMDKAAKEKEGIGYKVSQGYDDSSADGMDLLAGVVKEMARVGKLDCWVAMFCGAKHWLVLAELFRAEGFQVYNKPLVWAKTLKDGSPARLKSPVPSMWPASATDFILLARRGESLLAKMNEPDWFSCPAVQTEVRFHQAQKPVQLMEQIISLFFRENTNPLLIDPFAGSGSTLVAARRLGLQQYFGFELDPETREKAVAFLINSYVTDQEQKKAQAEGANLTLDPTDAELDF